MTPNRRLFLRGLAGSTIGLPLLEYTHGKAWAQGAPGAKRFITFFEHGGTISASKGTGQRHDGNGSNNGVDAWQPKSAPGAPLVLGAVHQPLQPFIDDLVIVGGVDNMAARKQGTYNGGHGWANVTALTAANVTKTGDSYTTDRASIDAVLATRLQQRNPTQFPQIHLKVPGHGYGTPFFRGPSQPNGGEWNPLAAFSTLFATVTTGATGPDPAVLRAMALRKSVLDGVSGGLGVYKNRLSATDKQTVDAHLEHIRGIEKQLQARPVTAGCSKPTVNFVGKPNSNDTELMVPQSPILVDIMVAALRCGLTNVASFEIGGFYGKFLNPTYPAAYNIDHSLHHSARDVGKTGSDAGRWQQWYDTMLKHRQFRMSLLARFMDAMTKTPEGGGTMMDQSLVLWTSEFSCGTDHSSADVPVLLAGKAGGKLRTKRYINYNTKAATNPLDYATQASTHNLFTSILNMFGYNDTQYGSNHGYVSGALPDLAT